MIWSDVRAMVAAAVECGTGLSEVAATLMFCNQPRDCAGHQDVESHQMLKCMAENMLRENIFSWECFVWMHCFWHAEKVPSTNSCEDI